MNINRICLKSFDKKTAKIIVWISGMLVGSTCAVFNASARDVENYEINKSARKTKIKFLSSKKFSKKSNASKKISHGKPSSAVNSNVVYIQNPQIVYIQDGSMVPGSGNLKGSKKLAAKNTRGSTANRHALAQNKKTAHKQVAQKKAIHRWAGKTYVVQQQRPSLRDQNGSVGLLQNTSSKSVNTSHYMNRVAPRYTTSVDYQSGQIRTAPSADVYQDAIRKTASSTVSTTSQKPFTGVTQTQLKTVAPAAVAPNPWSLRLNFFYYASSLGDPFGGYEPDHFKGFDSTDTVALDTQVAIGYQLTSNLTLSLNPFFKTTPTNKYAREEDPTKGNSLFMKPSASYARLQVGEFLKYGNFTWSGDFRFYPGITDDMDGLPFLLRTGQDFTFQLDKAWKFSVQNTIRYAYYTNSQLINNPMRYDWRLTSAPTIEFQQNDSLNWSFSYAVDVNHPWERSYGLKQWEDLQYGSNFELGLAWDVTKGLTLNPFIDLWPEAVSPFTMRWGANAFIKVL